MVWRPDISRNIARHLLHLLLVLGVAVTCPDASAAIVAVVLSEDSAPYQEVFNAVQASAGPEHVALRMLADQPVAADAVSSASLVISVGVKATESVARNFPRTPVIAALVPRDWYLHGGQNRLAAGERAVSAVFLDQPFSRQLRLVKEALPRATRIGVVLSSSQSWQLRELQSQARAFQFTISEAVLGRRDGRLVESLERVLPAADLLLALPDAEVFNRGTAQIIFLTTYRYRVPVIGYSRSLTLAGALVSIYSSPAQIGRHAGEMALRALSGSSIRLPPAQFPKYFSISSNNHVAKSLGIDLPEEEFLLKRVEEEGSHD